MASRASGAAPAPAERLGIDPAALTLGVEEEFHLVDLASRRLAPRATEVLATLDDPLFTAELQQSVVETRSEVAVALADLRADILDARRRLVEAGVGLGLGVAAAGTMPLDAPDLDVTSTTRYRRMLADYQLLVREQLICGMQVHVGVPDRDLAVVLTQRVAPWLPLFLALSASSPYAHDGDDTGYASSRSLIWQRWPTAGASGPLRTAADYDALVADLVASGVISDPGMIYFDVRPSAHVPTIELRVCDACPSVDVVVLIAGLFRALVAREAALELAGAPWMSIAAPLQRAAMWRAARFGLEGELVDLSGPRPAPAGVLVRRLVEELRPQLEAYGDWQLVDRLTTETLQAGSAASRQRAAARARGRITDVVDLLVEETAAQVAGVSPFLQGRPRLLDAYESPSYDEALRWDGTPRETHAGVLHAICALSPGELRRRLDDLERRKAASGVVFRPSGAATARSFPVDLIPRVVAGDEWSRLQGGLTQRARALNAFLDDVYGERAVVRDGVLPGWLVRRSPGLRGDGRASRSGGVRIQVAGFDVVRDIEGRWLVLEDNVRVPSGLGYALQNRRLLSAVLPELGAPDGRLDPEDAPALLRATLADAAPERAGDDPAIVLLTDGPADSAHFEHDLLAGLMGVPLVRPAELSVRDDGTVVRAGGERVDVVYLRMDEDLLEQRSSADGRPLGPELANAVAAGTLTIANALGNGVADDKAVYAFVPQLVEYYLGERPLIEQVPTYLCAEPDQQQLVLDKLDALVIKPVDGYGGLGVLIGPAASQAELDAARAHIVAAPGRWVAQEVVRLSTHPTVADGRIEPRHVDLRAFVLSGREVVTAPAALTRVAPAGELIVNSSRGGGSKDTWLFG
jgi:carboxylate-amine ligase